MMSLASPRNLSASLLICLYWLVSVAVSAKVLRAPVLASKCPYEPQIGGKSPPRFAEEYSFSFKQHKWNTNGYGVNHLSTGAWFSSLSQSKVRVDLVTLDWQSDNATMGGPVTSILSSSLFDYTKVHNDSVPNTYYSSDPMASNGHTFSCQTTDLPVVAAQGQLLQPDLLETQGVYQGTQELAPWGQVDKWGVWFGSTTFVTFYWAQVWTSPEDLAQVFVRYDEVSADQKTSVVTDIFDYRPVAKFASNVFTPCQAGK